ncbi:MAG: biotin synthase BioB, partial [Planctomycetota bacterium]|nr:biotin synthase BioB [Planctomycetota bacterium]
GTTNPPSPPPHSPLALIRDILGGRKLDRQQLLSLASDETDLNGLLYGANLLRQHFRGNTVDLCSLVNAKSGNCAEDCSFCAQSAHHAAGAKAHPMIGFPEIKRCYMKAQKMGASRFDIVTSGNELSAGELNFVVDSIASLRKMKSARIPLCASIGRLSVEQAKRLKDAGLVRCHHNIETSGRFFPGICTTHSFDERLETARNIKAAGLELCCGGVMGMGETWEDRVDMALTFRELGADAVPLNFLIPVKGTRLESQSAMEPKEILRTIALFRYALPEKDVRLCGGRERNLRDMQSWIFHAGANAMMIGGYLTQRGRRPEDDLQMLKDLGLEAAMGGR